MNSLPSLPKLDSINKNNYDTTKATPIKNNKPSLPNLRDIENENRSFSGYLDTSKNTENELMLTGELAIEYKKIKDSYRDLIYAFEQSIQRDMRITADDNSSKLKDFKFKNLTEFEKAVDQGFLNLKNYEISEINNLIKDLNDLENKFISRDLTEYNFKTLDDFQSAVDRGVIDLTRYGIAEINQLLSRLEDEPLKLSDYNIETFGNVDLSAIEMRLQNEHRYTKIPKPKSRKDTRIIKSNSSKPSSLPSPPKDPPKKPMVKDYSMIGDGDNIENILEKGFFSKLLNKIKDIFKKKRGP